MPAQKGNVLLRTPQFLQHFRGFGPCLWPADELAPQAILALELKQRFHHFYRGGSSEATNRLNEDNILWERLTETTFTCWISLEYDKIDFEHGNEVNQRSESVPLRNFLLAAAKTL